MKCTEICFTGSDKLSNQFACKDLYDELMPKCCECETIQQRPIVTHFDQHDVGSWTCLKQKSIVHNRWPKHLQLIQRNEKLLFVFMAHRRHNDVKIEQIVKTCDKDELMMLYVGLSFLRVWYSYAVVFVCVCVSISIFSPWEPTLLAFQLSSQIQSRANLVLPLAPKTTQDYCRNNWNQPWNHTWGQGEQL